MKPIPIVLTGNPDIKPPTEQNTQQKEPVVVKSSDVIRLILQFFKENNLGRSFQCLQEETGVYYAAIDNKDRFVKEVVAGNLTKLLEVTGDAEIPTPLLYDIFEHLALEMVDARQPKQLSIFLESTPVFCELERAHPVRYSRIISLRDKWASGNEIWAVLGGKLKRRKQLARSLMDCLDQVESSRLLSLLNKGMTGGRDMTGGDYDLFLGKFDTSSRPPTTLVKTISLADSSAKISASVFIGTDIVVTGDTTGDIIVWSWCSGEVNLDLAYQKEGYFLFHNGAITALAATENGKYLATADITGIVKKWDIDTGKELCPSTKVHTATILSLAFHPTDPLILSASADGTARLSYIKDGRVTTTFKNHDGIVLSALFEGKKANRVVTASTDGYVRVFDSRTSDLVHKFRPHSSELTPAIKTLIYDRRNPYGTHYFTHLVESHAIANVDSQGTLMKTYGKGAATPYVAIGTSSNSELLVGLTSKGTVHVFDTATGSLQSDVFIADGLEYLIYHPIQNLLALWGNDNKLLILRG